MQRFLHPLWPCLFALLVGGCATYQRQDLQAVTADTAFRKRSLNDTGLYAFVAEHSPTKPSTWPPQQLDITTITFVALYFHPDLEVARAKLAGAEAAIISAGARPNPTFAFSPAYSEPPIEFFSPWTFGFTLDVPIETAGKRDHRIAQAQALANSARLDMASTAWLVRRRARRALLDLYAAKTNAELLTQQQAVQDQTVGLLEERFKAGQSSLTDVQLVRVAATQTALQLRDAQTQSNQALVRLADAVGMQVNALSQITFSFDAFDQVPPPVPSEATQRQALQNRPDILGSLSDYEASQAALQLEIAKQYPDIHLGPGYTWNQGVNNYSLGLSLTLPLLDQNQGPIAEAIAHRQQSAATFTALQARVIGEVDAALAGYRDALEKLKTADTLLGQQRQRMQSMQESFDAGAADRLELQQTQLELKAGELGRATATVETQQALGLLEDAIRRPSAAIDQPTPQSQPTTSTSK